jgi:CubicO group peptidase (beta-lactamase class C family)
MLPERPETAPATDWDAMCAYLAGSAPLHPPGAQRHYHAITHSWLLGETARRADGRPFARIIEEEVCRPLGIDALFFGLPADALPRCVDAEKALPVPAPVPAAPPPPPDPVGERAVPAWLHPLEDWVNREDVRRACIPASNGYGSARAVARHYASLLGRGVDGVRLLTDATVRAATAWDASAEAAVPGSGRWGLGYALKGPDEAPGVVFGHGGYGGSTGIADTRHGLAVAVMKSRMGGTLATQIEETVRRCFGAL